MGDTDADPQRMENHGDRPEIKEAMAKGIGGATRYSHTLNEERMYVAIAVKQDSSQNVLVRTSVALPSINETLAALYYDFIVGGLMIAVLITAVSFWISLRIGRSLEAMMASTHHGVRRELRHRFPDLDSDEVVELAETVSRSTEEFAEQIRAARS